MKRKIPELDLPVHRHRKLTQEEREVWQRMHDTPPLASLRDAPPPAQKSAVPVKPGGRKKKTVVPEVNPLDKETLARIRRKLTAIEATFDLHGHTRHTGYDALAAFLRKAHAGGLRTVLIVTGRGRAGVEGILRTELPRWLGETALRGIVMAYDSALPAHGGSGAFYVRLRARPRVPASPS